MFLNLLIPIHSNNCDNIALTIIINHFLKYYKYYSIFRYLFILDFVYLHQFSFLNNYL